MPDRAPDYATPACNSVRAKNPPPQPDENGLFDFVGVIEIAGRRQCVVTIHSDLLLTVTAKAPIPLVAIQPGKWDPVSILSACTRAQDRQAFEVDESTAKLTNPNGIDEIRIARIVGADGLRPYLTRPSRYHYARFDNGIVIYETPQYADLIRVAGLSTHASNRCVGHPTWVFHQVIHESRWSDVGFSRISAPDNYLCRRAFRALEDVGLVTIKRGPRGDMATATIAWTERAYLPPTLNLYEHDAIDQIAAGLV